MSDHSHHGEYADSRHDHRGEYADERHDHDLDYAEKYHRHYDDEREVERLASEVRELRDALGDCRDSLADALDRIGRLEAAAAEQDATAPLVEFTSDSRLTSARCCKPGAHGRNLVGAVIDCDIAEHHEPARISEALVDNAMATQLGWCPATTGPDDELDRELYCDKQLSEDNRHAGNHHAHVGDGSEVAWGDEDDPWIRKGTCFGTAEQDGSAGELPETCAWHGGEAR